VFEVFIVVRIIHIGKNIFVRSVHPFISHCILIDKLLYGHKLIFYVLLYPLYCKDIQSLVDMSMDCYVIDTIFII
jgi:hypothetical protein